jgi:hypothetical protein
LIRPAFLLAQGKRHEVGGRQKSSHKRGHPIFFLSREKTAFKQKQRI